MPRMLPPVEHRFKLGCPSGNHTQKGPYLLPLLKKFLNKKINYEDPETQKIIKGRVKDAILWRLILNASQGDNIAIKEVLNRIDGKVPERIIYDEDAEKLLQEEIELIPSNGKKINNRIAKYLNQ